MSLTNRYRVPCFQLVPRVFYLELDAFDEGDAYDVAKSMLDSVEPHMVTRVDAAWGQGESAFDMLKGLEIEVDRENIESAEGSRGRWFLGERDGSDGEPSYLLTYTGRDYAEVQAEVQSICGATIEAPDDLTAAYVQLDSCRVREAAKELLAADFLLVDEDGEVISPHGSEDFGPEDPCDSCGEELHPDSINGGRCLSCGTMVCAKYPDDEVSS